MFSSRSFSAFLRMSFSTNCFDRLFIFTTENQRHQESALFGMAVQKLGWMYDRRMSTATV
jgi:hypothetical protein